MTQRLFTLTAFIMCCSMGESVPSNMSDVLTSGIIFKNVKITAQTGMRVRNAPGIDLSYLTMEVREGEPFIE